ncbi:MAG: hypothetical protein RIB59_04360 [Rhodospirillales bacterium]
MTKSYKIVSCEKSHNEFVVEYHDEGIAELLNIGFPSETTDEGIRKHILRHWPVAHMSAVKSSIKKDDAFIRELLEVEVNISDQDIDTEKSAFEAENAALAGAGRAQV